MTILVTGAAGYIGSHMTLELLGRGEKVIALDNLSTGFDWAVPEGVRLFVGETGNQNLVSSIIRAHDVESIIHFAASIVVPDYDTLVRRTLLAHHTALIGRIDMEAWIEHWRG